MKRRRFTDAEPSYIAKDLDFEFVLNRRDYSVTETFVLDTGSPVTIVREKALLEAGVPRIELPKSNVRLYGYCHKPPILREIRDPKFTKLELALHLVFVDPERDKYMDPQFGLLGLDFIDHFSFTFEPSFSTLELCPWDPGHWR
jgi:hypothetical protein